MKKTKVFFICIACACVFLGGCIQEGSVSDIDGNVYRTVIIDGREWMAENLRTTRYRTGINVSHVPDNVEWGETSTGAWAHYDNDEAYDIDYGKLYNWYAVDNTEGLCPEGWHIPSDDEWSSLIDYLGGSENAGCPLKKVGTNHWESPNTCATNSSGFTGLPGGYRDPSGFINLGRHGAWWSSIENNVERAWFRTLNYNDSKVFRVFQSKNNGISVRCVKD